MSEQELADLFSTQIDRILGGEPAVAVATDGDLPLLSLGQQLAQLNFQASPAAQAAFQGQLASWFETPGGGLPPTGLGFPKILLMSIGAMAIIGAGLGLVVLISFTWAGALFNSSPENQPTPAVTQPAPSNRATVMPPALATEPPSPASPTPPRPQVTSSLGDVLPRATGPVSDTILLPTSTLTPTGTALPATAAPGAGASGGGDSSSGSDPLPEGDQDRGHGNDPDGYDEDNPGQSQGVSGGAGQNQNSGGTLPGNLSGGNGGGGGSGGSNAGGGNSGGGQGGNGGDHGGGKGDKK